MARSPSPRRSPAPPCGAVPPDLAAAPASDPLAALNVKPESGQARAAVAARRKEIGDHEAAEAIDRPVAGFLQPFQGIAAWMPRLLVVRLAVLGRFADRVVVGVLLVVNSGLCPWRRRARFSLRPWSRAWW